MIEDRAGKSIREIFEQGGETLFRELESESLREVVARPASVISLGGGAILREANRDRLAQAGVCFWLDADAETIFGRLRGDASTAERRPALTNLGELEEIRELLRRRRPLYESVADYRIETDGKEAQEVSDQILARWLASDERRRGLTEESGRVQIGLLRGTDIALSCPGIGAAKSGGSAYASMGADP